MFRTSRTISKVAVGGVVGGAVQFGGGGLVQLFNASGFAHLGSAPLYSIPNGSDEWVI